MVNGLFNFRGHKAPPRYLKRIQIFVTPFLTVYPEFLPGASKSLFTITINSTDAKKQRYNGTNFRQQVTMGCIKGGGIEQHHRLFRDRLFEQGRVSGYAARWTNKTADAGIGRPHQAAAAFDGAKTGK